MALTVRHLVVCVFSSFLLAQGTASANLLTNGSFETPVVSPAVFQNFNTSDDIDGWTVVGNQVSIVIGAAVDDGLTFPAQDGDQWLDLTGFTSNSDSGVQQTVATVPGRQYELSFWIGNQVDLNGAGANYGTTSTIEVFVGGSSQGQFTNDSLGGTVVGTQHWEPYSLTFEATGAATVVEFRNRDPFGPTGDNSNGLDSVSMVELEPVPALGVAGFVLLFGLLLIAGFWRILTGLGSAPSR